MNPRKESEKWVEKDNCKSESEAPSIYCDGMMITVLYCRNC